MPAHTRWRSHVTCASTARLSASTSSSFITLHHRAAAATFARAHDRRNQCGIAMRRSARGLPVSLLHTLTMLTRSAVAARLGRSIATVRRLEGVHLHPRRDASGVYRFDRDEVEHLALAIRSGRRTLAGTPHSRGWKGWLDRRLSSNAQRGSPSRRRPRTTPTPSHRAIPDIDGLRRCVRVLAGMILGVVTPAQRHDLGPSVLATLSELAGSEATWR